jgi:Tol biopolymer transport system component
MAADGRSLVTAVGLTQRSVWLHDARGERQISLEGYAFGPQFGPDGGTLFFLKSKDTTSELWMADAQSGRTEPLLRDVGIDSAVRSGSYDLSPDGRRVVFSAPDAGGTRRIWVAATDRRTPPRSIPTAEGDGALFLFEDEILFRRREGTYGFAYAMRLDGTGLRKLFDHPVIQTMAVSPDRQWVVVYARPSEGQTGVTLAFPLTGGPPIRIFGNFVRWSRDGRQLLLSNGVGGYSGIVGRTFLIPLPRGQTWPSIPVGGFQSEKEITRIPGVRVIDSPDVAPGPSADVYAFSREAVQRNLYRIPLLK